MNKTRHTYKLEFVGMLWYNKVMENKKNTVKTKIKSAKQMERHLKGMANHYRIEILLLIDKSGGITLEDIITILNANAKTIGEHTRKLYQAGLVDKKYRGKFVEHTLSPYGRMFVRFLKSFQNV
jgi:DNA-binding transcriptional ArsR family regulator